MLIYLDYKKPLKNYLVNNIYQEYLTKRILDTSLIVGKLSEIVPSSINSCPLCFNIENYEHSFPHKTISELTIFKLFLAYIF